MFANLVYKVQISRWIYEISAELTGRLKATIEARSAELRERPYALPTKCFNA